MSLSIPITVKSNGDGEPPDWKVLKKDVIARLDIRKEYEELGIKFAGKYANEKGFIPCFAVGRPADDPDVRPSAAINVRVGFYLDKGLEDKATPFFKFAQEYGHFGSFIQTFRHYADKVGVQIGAIKRADAGFIVEETYDFLEPDGELKYQVRRLRCADGEKRFDQRMWDGERWKGGTGCMEGVAPLPYRFPELMAADPSDPVLWPEGEAKVDLAMEKGFVATCSHKGGTNFGNTVPHFLGRLPDRDYVVLPDNDPVGRKYALQVAGALHGHLASSGSGRTVKVVALPDLPVAGDIINWFDLGGTADELRALIAAAPAWEPGTPVEEPKSEDGDEDPEDPDGDCTIEDLAKHVSDSAWAWDGWIPSSALTLLAAEAGAGKTRLMMDLHRRAYHGEPWPDGTEMNLPPGGKALWIVADNHHEQMVLEAKAFGLFGMGALVINTRRAEPFGGTTLVTDDELAGLEARIRRNKPYWVVIDTITNTGDFKIQDAVDAKRQYKPLQEIAQRTKTPIICVTHTNASGKVLGRRAIEKVRVVILFSEPDRQGQPDRRKLWVEKSFAQKPPARGVTVSPGKYEYDDCPPEEPDRPEPRGGAGPKETSRLKECLAWLIEALGTGSQSVKDLIDMAEEEGHSKSTLYRAKEEHELITEYVAGNRKYWQLGYAD